MTQRPLLASVLAQGGGVVLLGLLFACTGQASRGSREDGAPCEDASECRMGRVCADGYCRRVCNYASPCDRAQEECLLGVCTPTGKVECVRNEDCTRPPTCRLAAGAVCRNGACQYGPRPSDAACDDGDACTAPDLCDGQGSCLSGADTCAGGRCTGDEDCASGYHCWSADSKCYGNGEGNPCDVDGECNSAWCDSGTCRTKLADGSAGCIRDVDCASGNCVTDYGGLDNYCVALSTCPNCGGANPCLLVADTTQIAVDYVLCSGNAYLKRCITDGGAATTWSARQDNPNPPGYHECYGSPQGGYCPGTCTSGPSGGFAPCVCCNGLLAASTSACYPSCLPDTPANGKCVPNYHCLDVNGHCYSGANDNPCDNHGECASGCCCCAGSNPMLCMPAIGNCASCPYVYAWDGRAYRYETDLQGPVIGLRKNVLAQYVRNFGPLYLPLAHLRPDAEGVARLKLREGLPEIDYIDELALLVVDHPQGTTIASSSPNNTYWYGFVEPFTLHSIAQPRLPRDVHDEGGRSLLTALSALDEVVIPTRAEPDPVLTVDFGTIARPEHAKLLIDGWTFFRDDYLADPVRPSTVEVRDAAGSWVQRKSFGFIAGDSKRMVVDLAGVFLSDDHRLRIRLARAPRVRWVIDRLMLDDSPPAQTTVTRVGPRVAVLDRVGAMPTRMGDYAHPIFANDERLLPKPMLMGVGMFTRLGDVRELLTSTDDRYVIMLHGDELRAEFPLPPAPRSGMERTYLLAANIYFKAFTLARTVEPLPFRSMSTYPPPAGESYPDDEEHRRYRATYNTRYFGPHPDHAKPIVCGHAPPPVTVTGAAKTAQAASRSWWRGLTGWVVTVLRSR